MPGIPIVSMKLEEHGVQLQWMTLEIILEERITGAIVVQNVQEWIFIIRVDKLETKLEDCVISILCLIAGDTIQRSYYL